ncbi:hypothetical protein GCM10023149_22640 [Mucilaginibacter gynuensis]|uniref:Uncharacterized protein n=1 Tax=Mucilaginibacter gynuensis TaxID=1302236 RepID=A0ABP8GE67_9SPHI
MAIDNHILTHLGINANQLTAIVNVLKYAKTSKFAICRFLINNSTIYNYNIILMIFDILL